MYAHQRGKNKGFSRCQCWTLSPWKNLSLQREIYPHTHTFPRNLPIKSVFPAKYTYVYNSACIQNQHAQLFKRKSQQPFWRKKKNLEKSVHIESDVTFPPAVLFPSNLENLVSPFIFYFVESQYNVEKRTFGVPLKYNITARNTFFLRMKCEKEVPNLVKKIAKTGSATFFSVQNFSKFPDFLTK